MISLFQAHSSEITIHRTWRRVRCKCRFDVCRAYARTIIVGAARKMQRQRRRGAYHRSTHAQPRFFDLTDMYAATEFTTQKLDSEVVSS